MNKDFAGFIQILTSHLNHRQELLVIWGPKREDAQDPDSSALLSHLISLLTHWSIKPSQVWAAVIPLDSNFLEQHLTLRQAHFAMQNQSAVENEVPGDTSRPPLKRPHTFRTWACQTKQRRSSTAASAFVKWLSQSFPSAPKQHMAALIECAAIRCMPFVLISLCSVCTICPWVTRWEDDVEFGN